MTFPRRHRAVLAVTAALLTLGSLAGCAAGGASSAERTSTIRYQTYSGSLDLTELADALGYLDGLTLDRVGEVKGGPESLRAVATGQVDYGAAFNGAIAQLASTGAPLKTVITYYGASEDVESSLLVRQDSDVRDARDLIGKKVAVNTLGANAEAVLDTYLAEEGLTQEEIDQVTLVPIPGINQEAALRSGQVEAAYLFGALREVALERGGVRALVTDKQLIGPYNAGGYVVREDFLAQNPDTVRTWVSGVARAIEWARNHPETEVRRVMKKYYIEHDRREQVQFLRLWEGTGVASKGGVIEKGDYDLWLDWLEKSGEVEPGSVDTSEIYTNEYNPYAKES